MRCTMAWALSMRAQAWPESSSCAPKRATATTSCQRRGASAMMIFAAWDIFIPSSILVQPYRPLRGQAPPTFEGVHSSTCGRGLAPDRARSLTTQSGSNHRSVALNKPVHILIRRRMQNLARRADLDQLAVLEDRDAVADAHGFVE